MSLPAEQGEHGDAPSLYLVRCCHCNIVLVVEVPQGSSRVDVMVRCGSCGRVLSVDMATFAESALPYQVHVGGPAQERVCLADQFSDPIPVGTSISSTSTFMATHDTSQRTPPSHDTSSDRSAADGIRGKSRRNPSAYNIFIREEIQRIKARNPNIDHKLAFSTAAKNWASCPQLCMGLEEVESAKTSSIFEEGGLTEYTDEHDEAQSPGN